MSGHFGIWFFLAAWLWMAGWIAASIIFRLNRGKPLFPKAPDAVVYSESRGSGRSLDTPWGWIGGASRCLIIAVTSDRLVVTPRFPFNLMFLPEIYGLDLDAPRSRVRVENPESGLFKNRVMLRIEGPDAKRMQLSLSDREAFIAALGV